MTNKIEVKSSRTYATEKNLDAAVAKLNLPADLRYFVAWDQSGRCYPVFVGPDALRYGVHFHFPVVG